MAVREILQVGDPILRQRSVKITHFDGALSRLVDDMVETMHAANGVGLAAPQVGVSRRVIVVEMPSDAHMGDDREFPHPGERFVLCNPKIVKASRETEIAQEGCLSVAGYVGEVERSVQVIVNGQNLQGRQARIKADGFLARAFQHEIDHLDGILYVDIAEEGSIVSLEELRQAAQEQQANGEQKEMPAVI